jgi:opacity protein-like surface antigen
MKRAFLLTVVLLTISSFSLAQTDSLQSIDAGTSLTQEVSVQGGFTFPYMPGGFRDTMKAGWNGGIGYGIVFSPGEIGYTSLSLNLDYNKFKAKGEVEGKSFTAMVNFKGAFTKWLGPVHPYFSVGVGYMFFSSDSFNSDTLGDGGYHHMIGWNVAVGLEVPVTDQFIAYVQGQSVIGSLEKPRQYFPVCAGVRMRIF